MSYTLSTQIGQTTTPVQAGIGSLTQAAFIVRRALRNNAWGPGEPVLRSTGGCEYFWLRGDPAADHEDDWWELIDYKGELLRAQQRLAVRYDPRDNLPVNE